MIFCPFELEKSWQSILEKELKKPYIAELVAFIEKERKMSPYSIYPPEDSVFNAFKQTSFEDVKAVIIGQDPYHGPGQAHGLAFSVPQGIPQPPSLRNIFKEIESDLEITAPKDGCLSSWAEQGVMLLNATLTVREGSPLSHHGKGWERLTDAVVEQLIHRKKPLVFLLWGKSAQKKCKTLSAVQHPHLVLTTVHPSPLSAYQGFFGCRHFSQTNRFLEQCGMLPINWGK